MADDFMEKYGLWVILGLVVVILVGGAYFFGYVNGRPAPQPNATVTYVYMYVTPVPTATPTPYPPNVMIINNQPIAIVGKDTPAIYDSEIGQKDDADKITYLPAVNTNGLLAGSGYYNVRTGVFHAYTDSRSFEQLARMFGETSAASIINASKPDGTMTVVGDIGMDWEIRMDPRLNYTERSVGTVHTNGTYTPPVIPEQYLNSTLDINVTFEETAVQTTVVDNETGFTMTIEKNPSSDPTTWDEIFTTLDDKRKHTYGDLWS